MSGESRAELVFIPSPGRGHLLATLEMAKLLLRRDERLSITVLVIKPFFDPTSSAHSYSPQSDSRIRFVDVPRADSSLLPSTISPVSFHSQFIDSHKDHVRNEVAKLVRGFGPRSRLSGFVVDMFCMSMMDVADELGVSTYVFFTSGASVLGLMFHFQGLRDYQNQDLTSLYDDSSEDILIPSYKSPVPPLLLPSGIFDKDGGSTAFLNHTRRCRQTKGILVNTFLELESQAIKSLSDDEKIPPVYPVGPIIDGGDDPENPKHNEIMKWLDEQPYSSVVFLCVGSKGVFDREQVREIAVALERSGHRFLWSLRKPPSTKFGTPVEYEDPGEVLPENFLGRTAGIGKLIGWAPQLAVLSHRAVGGFVSHCGWNSTLESMWCGVPMAAWPLFAEQKMNAFQLVNDLGVGVGINLGDCNVKMVRSEEIESGITRVMESGSDVRVRVDEMKEMCRKAIVENGSSFDFVTRFISNLTANIL